MDKKIKNWILEHGVPQTRRQFLASGLSANVAMLMAPSFFTTIARASTFFDDPSRADAPNVPFLVVDMVGGSSMPGNFLVGKQGGPEDLLASYSFLGWNPRTVALDKRFGIPMAGGGVSKMLEGMGQTMSADAQKLFRMGSFCHIAQDDTSTNKTSAILEVSRSGLIGTDLRNGIGLTSRLSGANTGVPKDYPPFKPLEIARVDDIQASSGLAPLQNVLNSKTMAAIVQASKTLVDAQKAFFKEFRDGEMFGDLTGSAHTKNLETVQSTKNPDPRVDPIFQAVYGINAQTASTDFSARAATVVRSVITRSSGPGAIFIADCDYHVSNQTTGDARDLQAGRAIGQAVEAAHRLKTPLVIQFITDGGVSSSSNTRIWTGEAGDKCATIMGYYNPTAAPEMRRLQVSNYTDGQGAATNFLFGTDTAKVGYAVLANYLNICKRLDLFPKLVSATDFPTEKVDEILLFA